MTVTNTQRSYMRELIAKGWSVASVAALTGWSKETVYYHVNAKAQRRIKATWARRDAKRRERRIAPSL